MKQNSLVYIKNNYFLEPVILDKDDFVLDSVSDVELPILIDLLGLETETCAFLDGNLLKNLALKCGNLKELKFIKSTTENILLDIMTKDFPKCTIKDTDFTACANLDIDDKSLYVYYDTDWLYMGDCFKDCFFSDLAEIEHLDLSMFLGLSTSPRFDFSGCNSLKILNLEHIDLTKYHDFSAMFEDCFDLESIIFNKKQLVFPEDCHTMFARCVSLKKLDLRGFVFTINDDFSFMFTGCKSIESIIFSKRGVYCSTSMKFNGMFRHCNSLKVCDLSWLRNLGEDIIDKMYDKTMDNFLKVTKIKAHNYLITN